MRQTKIGRLQEQNEKTKKGSAETGIKANVGVKSFIPWLKLDGSIFAKVKLDDQTRKTVREIFTLYKPELCELINNIIADYNKIQPEKELLLIIDDLEKVQNQAQSKSLFIDNLNIFHTIKCTKILTFPVYLTTLYAMFQRAYIFSIRIDPNPYDTPKAMQEDETWKKNRTNLIKVIENRLARQDLIDNEAVEKAVTYSGGNLRSLMDIMQRSAINSISLEDEADNTNTKIAVIDIETAVKEAAALPSLAVMRRAYVLKYVLDNKKEPADETMRAFFLDSVLDNTVFAYFNVKPWYDINPILKDSVKAYAEDEST